MTRTSFLGFLVLAAWATLVEGRQRHQPLRVVPAVDLDRYMGTWYEIARLPNRFQRECAGEVMATYERRDDGRIRVVNQCRTDDGEMQGAEGVARLANESGPNSKLKVRFAPAFLSFLPFVWGNYWILEVASDYRYAVVGEPDRKYLWILSRTPQMDQARYQEILTGLATQGYDTNRLVKTKQVLTHQDEFSRADEVTRDGAARRCFHRLWIEAREGRLPAEKAAWIIQTEGTYECLFWPRRLPERHQARWRGVIPAGTVGLAHTHPRTVFSAPSLTDIRAAERLGIPVYAISRDGIWKVSQSGEETLVEGDEWFDLSWMPQETADD